MLYVPPSDEPFRIVGIDPGSDTMGLCVFHVHLEKRTAVVVDGHTVNATLLSARIPQMQEIYGDKIARLCAINDYLTQYLSHHQPHAVITEMPFMGRFPAAFAALTECVSIIRQAVMNYDPYVGLQSVDPPSAKKAVGVSGKGSNKEEVADAICHLPDLEYHPDVNPHLFDEHTSDSAAVAYWYFKQLLEQ